MNVGRAKMSKVLEHNPGLQVYQEGNEAWHTAVIFQNSNTAIWIKKKILKDDTALANTYNMYQPGSSTRERSCGRIC